MKNIFLVIIAISSCFFAHGQSYEFTSRVKVDYEMYLNFNEIQKYEATLYAGKSSSFFTYQRNQEQNEDQTNSDEDQLYEGKANVKVRDSATYDILRVEDTLYSLMKKLDDNSHYYLKEQNPELKWEMANKTKEIDSIKCQLATVKFRGRNYEAWYAPSIPIKSGPYKFNGLPGLILEMKDTENEVTFKAQKIRYQTESMEKQLNPTYDVLTLDEYLDIRKQRSDQVKAKFKKIESRMGRGVKMNIDNVKIKEIERSFDDVEQP